MKLLLLSPQIDATHEVVKALQEKGIAVLLPADAKEAFQMLQLHGASVDLALIHREGLKGQGTPGLDFVSKIKADPTQADLPFILTTDIWSDAQCVEHQNTPMGANAYLRAPFQAAQLFELMSAVSGQSLDAAPAVPSAPAVTTPPAAAPPPSAELPPLELEAPPSLELSAAPALEAPDPMALKLESPPSDNGTNDSGEIRLEIPTAAGETPPALLTLDPSAQIMMPEDMPEITLPTATFSVPEGAPGELPKFSAAEPEASPEASEDSPEDAAAEMPYLYKQSGTPFAQPVGDAVVPGGAAHSPDMETLKKYLLLREQDVAALSGQLKASREQIGSLDAQLRQERAINVELSHQVQEQVKKAEDSLREKEIMTETLQNEVNEAKFQLKTRSDKARVLEAQVREATEEMERLKERVRSDIRKIRVREKELENRLEIMKKDSEALISARENKIVELKRKLDLLEFNMDLLQEQYVREKDLCGLLRERLAKASQALRAVGGLLDETKTTEAA